jgi:plasmid rolling circle replication initiator protein Rep
MLLKDRLLRALPVIELLYPKARWIFMTLTMCDYNLERVSDLSSTLMRMSLSWKKFVKRREFYRIVLGWVRTTRLIRGINRTVYPHFHVLALVEPGYFGEFYVSNARWTELWRQSTGLDYTPIVDVRVVKDCREFIETMKCVVSSDDLKDEEVSKNRLTATGGVLRRLLRRKSISRSSIIGKSYLDHCDYPNSLPIAIDGNRRVYQGKGKIYLVQDGVIIDCFSWNM